ncbi:hypothetical protein JL722_10640 [Aureococcus anophagefferens]|nr:hypothetical protein JL722_10640 [Aureococcus anophagefferens]
MPFAPVGNLIDTEVRQRRVKRSASSRVRMTMRGLPEPTDVERWKKPAPPQKKRSRTWSSPRRERENAKLEVSRDPREDGLRRVATRLGAVLEDAEKRVRDLAATAIQAWARGLRAKKRRIVRKLSRFVPLTLWRRRERNRLAAKQLRTFFLDHERPARVKRHIHDFLRAVKLVQRIYRGYAACTVARRKALGMLWQRAEAAFAPPRERRPLAPVKPRNGSPDEARAFARRKILARREDQRDDAKRRDDARGLARLDRQWDVVDARMAHLVRPEEAPAKRRKEQKWAMPAKGDDTLAAIVARAYAAAYAADKEAHLRGGGADVAAAAPRARAGYVAYVASG